MGTSTSVAQLVGKLDKLAAEMADTSRPLQATAMRGKQIFLSTATASGAIGKKPAGKRKKIGVRYDIRDGSAVILYTGPAHLLNNPTRGHDIAPRRGRGVRTRRRGARALRFPDGGIRLGPVHHPGTAGKRFYERARVICEHELPRVYGQKQLTEPLRRTFH